MNTLYRYVRLKTVDAGASGVRGGGVPCLKIKVAPVIHVSNVTPCLRGEYMPVEVLFIVYKDLASLFNDPYLPGGQCMHYVIYQKQGRTSELSSMNGGGVSVLTGLRLY